MSKNNLQKSIIELYRQTASTIPDEIYQVYNKCLEQQDKKSSSFFVLNNIIKNINIARSKKIPICQDTGIPNFFVIFIAVS